MCTVYYQFFYTIFVKVSTGSVSVTIAVMLARFVRISKVSVSMMTMPFIIFSRMSTVSVSVMTMPFIIFSRMSTVSVSVTAAVMYGVSSFLFLLLVFLLCLLRVAPSFR